MVARLSVLSDFRKMLDRKDIDAVVVSTPDHWHALMTIMACAAGKDVYVEKPLTLFIKKGDGWLKRPGTTNVSYRWARNSAPARLIRNVWNSFVPAISVTCAASACTPSATSCPALPQRLPMVNFSEEDWKMWLGPAPYVPFDKQRCIYHFRWFWDYSGGQTTNLLAHEIDIVQWVTQQLPQSVAAMGGRYSLTGIGETPDIFEALFQYKQFIASWSCREIAGPGDSALWNGVCRDFGHAGGQPLWLGSVSRHGDSSR